MKQTVPPSHALWLVLLLAVGCAQGITVRVNGSLKSTEPIPSGVSYAILPAGDAAKDQQFLAYAGLLARKLNGRGYQQVEGEAAKLRVFLAYSVVEESSREEAAASTGTTGTTGGAMRSSAGIAGTSSMYGSGGSSSNRPNLTAYTTQVTIVVVDYERSRVARSLVELWRGEALVTERAADLARIAPTLIDAALRQFGETTPHELSYTFRDEEVAGNTLGDAR